MTKRKLKIETCRYAGARFRPGTCYCMWADAHEVPPPVHDRDIVVDSVDCGRCKCWEDRDE